MKKNSFFAFFNYIVIMVTIGRRNKYYKSKQVTTVIFLGKTIEKSFFKKTLFENH